MLENTLRGISRCYTPSCLHVSSSHCWIDSVGFEQNQSNNDLFTRYVNLYVPDPRNSEGKRTIDFLGQTGTPFFHETIVMKLECETKK